MGSLDIAIEEDPMPGLAEAEPQLDVLYGGTRKTFGVEPSDRQEDLTPNGAASGPEGRGLRIPLLVDEVVQEVSILRDESAGTRLCVV
jgi:hypothetical protein